MQAPQGLKWHERKINNKSSENARFKTTDVISPHQNVFLIEL